MLETAAMENIQGGNCCYQPCAPSLFVGVSLALALSLGCGCSSIGLGVGIAAGISL